MIDNPFSSYHRLAIAATVLASSAVSSFAVPADPRPRTFTQPDGTSITVQIRGDERGHFYLSEDDYLLVNRDGAFYYGNADASGLIIDSGILAHPVGSRTDVDNAYLRQVEMPKVFEALQRRDNGNSIMRAPLKGPGLFEGTHFPVHGEQKAIVVLVDYQDVKFNLEDPFDYFDRMLNQEGFSDYGGTGSARDFFITNSCGQFLPQFDVYGPITLSHDMKYYGGNDWMGSDKNAYEMVTEACQQLDETVDFTEYDRDGDGKIDNVFIFYAGRGEATGGSPDTVWPHSWDVTSATSKVYKYDGVQLDRYGCSNEWESGRPDGVGTFVHEFSHVMGLPDLYATSYTSAFTPGSWSALDYGPYNNDGCTPPNYGAFERYALCWVDPTLLTGPDTVTLNPVEENDACIIPSGNPNEFFLLENRQRTGWDKYIPGHGMLIWHVDYNPNVWSSNTVNNSSSHQYVDIEEADGTQNSWSVDSDPFPGTKRITSFTDDTNPSMRLWNGKGLGLPLTDISEDRNGVITFKVAGGRREVTPVTVTGPDELTDVSFSIAWSKDPKAERYLVNIYTLNGEEHNYLKGWNLRDVGNVTETMVEHLKPLTTYYCEVYSAAGPHMSDISNILEVTTSEPTFSSLAPVAVEAAEVGCDKFTARWTALPDATGYVLSVCTKGEWTSSTDGSNFSGGLAKLPGGWETSSKLTYGTVEYSGLSTPSLRLSVNGNYIKTPVYDMDIQSLSFWHRGSGNDQSSSSIRVLACSDDESELIAELPVSCAEGGEINVIDELPEGVRQICILFEGSKGDALAVDDIELIYGVRQVQDFVEGYDSREVGCVTSYEVVNLKPTTEYYYTVVASDGLRRSLVSNETKVTTTDINAISDIVSDGSVKVTGRGITVDGKPGENVDIYDINGRRVMSSRTDVSGHLAVTLHSPGIYMLSISDTNYKVIIK